MIVNESFRTIDGRGVYTRFVEQTIDLTDEISVKQALESSWVTPDDTKGKFFRLIDQFLKKGGDPNLTFTEITIGKNEFHYPTFFHVVYLYWKCPSVEWDPAADNFFEDLID